MAQKESLGLWGWDTLDFIVHDLERSKRFYAESFGLPLIGESSEAYTAETGEKKLLFGRAGISVACVSSQERGSLAERYLRRHPDGVAVVGFRVKDLAHTHRVLARRGATFSTQVISAVDHSGAPYRYFEIATSLGEVRFRFVERHVNTLPPGINPLEVPLGKILPYQSIDHLTSNLLSLEPHVTWLRDVMGFEEYWRVEFHTSDTKGSEGSGLASVVMWDPESKVKTASNEPAIPNFEGSQIYKFIEDNNGPGVQHIAFHVPNIQETVEILQHRGLDFLDVPDSYYAMLPKRLKEHHVTNFTEDINHLRDLGVLVDGDDDKYLLQLFMQDGAVMYEEESAGPFFYEIIQRKGARLFGEGNFRALFESIEREQSSRT